MLAPRAPLCEHSVRGLRQQRSVRFAGCPRASRQQLGPALTTSLVGQPVLQLDANSSAVPLLEPSTHDTPFAAAIHITRQRASSSATHAAGSSSSSSNGLSSHPEHAGHSSSTLSTSSAADADFVELHYVLSGSGVCHAPSGTQHSLLPGDCILSTAGALHLTAAAGSSSSSSSSTSHTPTQDKQQQQQQPLQPAPLAAAVRFPDLTAFLQRLRAPSWGGTSGRAAPSAAAGNMGGAGPGQAQQQQQQQVQTLQPEELEPLVTLQLLVPASVLTGDTPITSPAHQVALAGALPWRHAAPGATLTPAAACELLSASLPLLQHHEDTDPTSSSSSEGGAMAPLYHNVNNQQVVGPLHTPGAAHPHHLPSEQAHTTAGDSSSSRTSSVRLEGAPPAALPLLGVPPSPTKRALTEVACWQLPAQSNRLALLFGPHAAPAVSLSFGLEIFEPGHITPRHVHPGAYELFFVVAGEGLGVVRHTAQDAANTANSGHTGQSSSGSSSSGGSGSGRWREEQLVLSPGDVAVFPPGVVHALDNPHSGRLYCLQLMVPDEAFVSLVTSGTHLGALSPVELAAALAARAGC